ncbi:MAG: hypothetical protein ACTSQP_18445 [Promethearchaeota archaeon]
MPIDMKVGYNIITQNDLKEGKFIPLSNKLSIIEFLRKLQKKVLPADIQIIGLDQMLYFSENYEELSHNLREILIDNIEYLGKNYTAIQIICENLERWDRVYVKIKGKEIYLDELFGPLKELEKDYFYKYFNIIT